MVEVTAENFGGADGRKMNGRRRLNPSAVGSYEGVALSDHLNYVAVEQDAPKLHLDPQNRLLSNDYATLPTVGRTGDTFGG